MNLVDPRGMDIMEWVDSTADNLSPFVRIMKLDSGKQWREWADYARQSLVRRGILTPDQRQFPGFEEWAMRFNQVIVIL